jgi:glycerophosphoryl diester phosphodiesterase
MECFRPIVWAHRGSRKKSPENTLESFLRAEWEGADGVELDVRLSGDGVPVVMHDGSLKRTTGVDALVGELSFREIKGFFPGVPSLEEVFRIHGGRMRFNVELKTDPVDSLSRVRRLAQAVACLFARSASPEECMASAFDPRAVDEFKRAAPRYRAGWLLKPRFFSGSRFSGRPRSFDALHPHFFMVSRRFVAAARAAGKQVNVWTVNGPLLAARLASWGADGLITDRASDLLERFDPDASDRAAYLPEAVNAV